MLKPMKAYGIGDTPLVEIHSIHGNRIFLKLEQHNYLGSTKTRNAYQVYAELPAEADGKILIESSSGNLGMALGVFGQLTNRRFCCLIDPSIAEAKLKKLRDYNISYITVEAKNGLDYRSSRIQLAREMMESGEYYWVNQYDNESCVRAHTLSTGPEVWKQTYGAVTHCVFSMGSGSSVIGTGLYLKQKSSSIRIYGAEPYGSTIFGTVSASYINVGTGLVGKPGNILRHPDVIDGSYVVTDDESIYYAEKLYRDHGLAVGVSTGTAYAGAVRLAQTIEGGTIVVLAPDGRDSYHEYF